MNNYFLKKKISVDFMLDLQIIYSSFLNLNENQGNRIKMIRNCDGWMRGYKMLLIVESATIIQIILFFFQKNATFAGFFRIN